MASQISPTKPADVHGSTTINDDVLYEILLRLPAKPLCRLRAVCRSWRSLLSAPLFIAAHKARQAGPLLVIRDREHDGSTVSVHILDILSGKSVRQIRVENSRGRFMISLVLLMRAPQDLPLVRLPGNIDDGLRLRVLDPATATDFALPHVHHGKQQPYRDSFTVGRASTGAYKVLCISTSMSSPMSYLYGHQLCRVLTLSGDHGWRETGCPPAEVETFHRRNGAAVKGVAYFLSTKKCIEAYDLEKEVWRTASLPAPAPSREQVMYHTLTELGGCLALAYQDKLGFVELWLLVDPDQVIWSRLCTISVPYRHNGVQDWSPRLYLAEPLWLLDDGRIIIWMWMAGLQLPTRVLCAYDPRTMTYTDVADMRNYTLGGVFTGSMLDQESIHLLHQ